MTTQVRVSELAKGRAYGTCLECHDVIACWDDLDGYWIECRCDAGYYDAEFIILGVW